VSIWLDYIELNPGGYVAIIWMWMLAERRYHGRESRGTSFVAALRL
jgi:hypothetical protein